MSSKDEIFTLALSIAKVFIRGVVPQNKKYFILWDSREEIVQFEEADINGADNIEEILW